MLSGQDKWLLTQRDVFKKRFHGSVLHTVRIVFQIFYCTIINDIRVTVGNAVLATDYTFRFLTAILSKHKAAVTTALAKYI